MRIVIKENIKQVGKYAADLVVQRINEANPTKEHPFVLGLPTGGSIVSTYSVLIEYYRRNLVSFEHVVTFNMDEYVGLPKEHPQSYHSFMHETFFKFVNVRPENINIPDGNAKDLVRECMQYEEKIKSYGGIDLQLGGIGPGTGHIAFNEAGSSLRSRTRVKSLCQETIAANARFFDNDIKLVPTMAITVGMQTVMEAKQVVILATGSRKSTAVAAAIEGAVSHNCPASLLQMHPSCVFLVDEEATLDLKVKTVLYYRQLAAREHELAHRQENAKKRSKL